MLNKIRSLCVLLATTAALALAGCAGSDPRPVDSIADAEAVIRQAEQGDAAEHSPLELDNAREKLAAARAAANAEEFARADMLAQQATADAELAIAIAESAEASAAAEQIRAGIATLRQEASR